MVATFILTRAFAISALFVGAFPVVHAAPAPSPSILDAVALFASRLQKSPHPPVDPSLFTPEIAQAPHKVKRSCRQVGCLRDDASASDDDLNGENTTGAAAAVREIPNHLTSPPSKSLAPDTASAESKRSCRQVGCLRALTALPGTLGAPSVDAFARAPPPEAAPADSDSAHAVISQLAPSANAEVGEVKEVKEQQGKQQRVEDTISSSDEVRRMAGVASGARGCRQVGCLRDEPPTREAVARA
ncbi:hypothetical protein C8Q77DRAFT_288199 [Trametes polyzona]|nr:hypothetical protein C8Q77DRAFT_288199 [Trametes polyzona]